MTNTPITTLPHTELMKTEDIKLNELSPELQKQVRALDFKFNQVKNKPGLLMAKQNDLAAESAILEDLIDREIFPDDPKNAAGVPTSANNDVNKDQKSASKTYGLSTEKTQEFEAYVLNHINSDGRIHMDDVQKWIPERPDLIRLPKITLERVSLFVYYYDVKTN
ncbi:MAG: hypothetical protein EXR21_09065 [Flavobacteriaceae bacterium]|nr:hypothetical protein [Flavobacteriaceae bacterium]